VITGKVLDDNEVLLEAVKKAVESFTVLGNSTFSALPGTATNTAQSQTQSESDVEGELSSLTDYGTSATLYASDTVNVRLQPSTEADVMTMLSPGDSVTVVGETSQWFKVNILGNIGYISKAFLVYKKSDVQTETTAQQTDAVNSTTVSSSTMTTAELNSYVDYGTGYTYYTTTGVNLRQQPGTDSDVVATVDGGAAVSVIGETDNWFVVSVNGTTGYISKSYISSSNPGTTSSSSSSSGGSTTSSSGGSTSQTSGTGTVSGTIVGANSNTITIQGDDGYTYNINYTDASVNTANGFQTGLYITATVDYSGTSPTGELYATSVSGY
jgi:uncharacterized protein YgiM (DUF1202 family)